jgi:DNA polymerase I-like protein with 3'-5' exonuclease and polymerase domains
MKLIGFDLETSGLQPWLPDAEIYSMAAYHTAGSAQRMPTKEYFRDFLTNCAQNDLTIVGWNVMFDIAWLLAYDLEAEVRACKWLDAMLLLKRIDGMRFEYGLKTIVAETWPQHADYGIDDFSKPTTEEGWVKLIEYNLKDVVFTLTLAKQYVAQLTEKELDMARTESDCLIDLAKSWIGGIRINEAALAELQKENPLNLAKWLDVAELTAKIIASSKQLSIALYDDWKLPVLVRTDRGVPSTSKDAINLLAVEFPNDTRLKALLEVRKCLTTQSKFIDAVQKSVVLHGSNITRPQPQAGGTYTSRLTYSSSQGKNKDKKQTGIALHQWSRDKRVRAELEAPPGFILGEWDFSGQEMRLMADISEDETMLSLFLDGIDGHSFMGASIEGIDWKWVHEEQDTNPEAKSIRYLGKFCIAEGELVLTNNGLKPIESVTIDDTVWDGIGWVSHTGVVYQGDQEVLTYDGLTATPKHRVYLEDGRNCQLWEAAQKGLRICKSGNGGCAIPCVESSGSASCETKEQLVSELSVHELREYIASEPLRSLHRALDEVQKMRDYRETPQSESLDSHDSSTQSATETSGVNDSALQQPKRSSVQKLRCAWGSVQVWIGKASSGLYSRSTTSPNVCSGGDRPDKQFRPLRAGESSTCNEATESSEQANCQNTNAQRRVDTEMSCVPCTEDSAPRDTVHTGHSVKFSDARADLGSDHNQMGRTKLQTKRTYDITNAGPRHRYTVSDRLVFNSNLSLQYRIGIDTMRIRALTQYGLNLSQQRATHIKAKYLTTYSGVPVYWNKAIRQAMKLGYAETRGGHRIKLHFDGQDSYQNEQTAINFPIQGTGGDMKLLALSVIKNHFAEMGAHFAWDLHDALFLYLPDDQYAEGKARKIREILSNLPYKQAWGWEPKVPLPVDCKIGKNWGSLKGLK